MQPMCVPEMFFPNSAVDSTSTVLLLSGISCVYYLCKYLIYLCRDLPVSARDCKYFNSVNAQLQTGPAGSAASRHT